MTEDEVQRLREQIQHDQTSCRCGHLLAACADCMGWMREHSPRIAASWRWYVTHVVGMAYQPAGQLFADHAERDDRAYFGL
jgi:hypothetical protein